MDFLHRKLEDFPEQIRKKVIRFRWVRSMFPWILQTKPEKAASSGETIQVVAGRGPGRLKTP